MMGKLNGLNKHRRCALLAVVLFILMLSFILVIPSFSPLYKHFNKTQFYNKGLVEELYKMSHQNAAFTSQIESAKIFLLQQFPTQLKVRSDATEVIGAFSTNFFEKIQEIPQTKTIIFDLPGEYLEHLLPKQFYTVHSNDCKRLVDRAISTLPLIDKKCIQTSRYPFRELDFYISQNGINNLTGIFHPRSDSTSRNSQHLSDSKIVVDFLHVVKDAVVVPEGDFHVGKYQFSIQRCKYQSVSGINKIHVPKYTEVYSIAQFWGEGFFHFAIEDLPRMMIGLKYLIENTEVKVHVKTKGAFVDSLLGDIGIAPNRLVSGVVRADILYVPRGTYCGLGGIFNTNSLSTHIQALSGKPSPEQDTIILIKRSTRRWFKKHGEILKMIQDIALKRTLRVQVYGDNPVLGLYETKELFRRAVMVVAPHGAGLSNLIFSQRGTCVVEGLCYSENKVNLCYQHLAYTLGHRYHGVVMPYQCLDMTPADLQPQIVQCLNAIS